MTKTVQAHQLYFIIINYNSSQLIKRLIDSLWLEMIGKDQVIIVNNSPEDKGIHRLGNGTIEVIEAESNLGFGRACNLGLDWIYSQDPCAIAWLINPDTYFRLDSQDAEHPINMAIAFFQEHAEISILGTTVYDSDDKLISAGGTFTPGTAALTTIDYIPKDTAANYWHTDWTSGCSLLINLAKFTTCPYFDPHYFLYYEDLDFCLRYGQQGHKIAVTPLLKVFHDISTISDRNLFTKYQHVTYSYLIHIEKHGSLSTFIRTNLRMMLNTLRLLIFKPEQGLGKLIGIYRYWQTRLIQN